MINRDSCELCGSSKSDWKALFNKSNFTIVKCEKCKLIFTQEIPSTEELEIAYSEQYFNGDIYNNYNEASMQKKRGYVSLLSNFQSLTGNKTGTILEVGCATGFFLDAAKFLEYETYGIEISKWASKIATKKGHKVLNISISDILNSEFKNIKYDCIFMLDVFEHLTNPRQVLENLMLFLSLMGI
jgi:2-polyprenyl-3-methyl-5-hydroxy-6-metoxy-1,4-benzoquinol methylase